MVTIEGSLDSVTVGEFIFKEQRIDEHLLMDPKLTGFQIPLELHTKKGAKWP